MQEIEKYKSLIRSSGLRSTPPRVAVLQILSDIQTPLSHGDLVDKLSTGGFDRATIFRNLNDMTNAGLLKRIDIGDHTWRFELKDQINEALSHPHFVCTDCGDVACLTELPIPVAPMALKNKVSNISEVLLKGHCDDCGD